MTAGIVGIGLVQWLYFVAIARLPVGITLLLEYLAPVFVALWVCFVRHEPGPAPDLGGRWRCASSAWRSWPRCGRA